MNSNFKEEQKYILAKKRVERVRKFYKHLAVFVVVNIFLSVIFILGDIDDGDTLKEAFFNYHNYKIWFYWGLGILFQALNTFGLNLIFNKNWEERKIKEFMKNEQQQKF